MPRHDIAVADRLEYLSILDEDGTLDQPLEPQLTDDQLVALYRAMLLGRRFDERMLDLQRQGRIGTFPPIKGQEAAQMGAVFNLHPGDWFVPAFRETAAEIWRGRPLDSFLLYFNGYNEGSILPENRKDLPIAIPVGSQILHAAGLAWAASYRGTDEMVMTFFGDGATSQGDFHEGLNMAAVYQLPLVAVCQNNQWAISVPVGKQTASETLAVKALAYGMPGVRVDGNDVLACYVAAKAAVDRARAGGGPTFIECLTYRLGGHSSSDDPTKYRDENEAKAWELKDPLLRHKAWLVARGEWSEAREEAYLAEAGKQITDAIAAVEAAPPPALDTLFRDVYATVPPHLLDQQRRLERGEPV